MKSSSTFFSRQRIRNAIGNTKKYPWASRIADQALGRAREYAKRDDDELWALPYGPELYRAIDVSLKLGCPNCGPKIYEGRRTYYAWEADYGRHPWKLRCPGCSQLFPKNDFLAFYRSGLGVDGLFHHDLADETLLFNAEHPDPRDPKHKWGVDDGRSWEGHWWIAYYAMRLWLDEIVPAVDALSGAYVLTGEQRYAHKCAVLLDRVADIYPDYDGETQHYNVGWKRFAGGYIGADYYDLAFLKVAALAYDRIFTGMKGDQELIEFLREKAATHGLRNPKRALADICRNIEERLLTQIIEHPGHHIGSNGSRDACVYALAKMVLRGRAAKDRLLKEDLPLIADPRHFHEDGSSGERAVGYDFGHITLGAGDFITYLCDYDKQTARKVLREFPNLHRGFYFQVNLRCLDHFVPNIGDAGAAGKPTPPLYHEAHARLLDLTGDPLLGRYLHFVKKGSLKGVHTGIHGRDPGAIQGKIREAVERHGTFDLGSVHYPDYRLAIFRSGKGPDRRALWVKYTSEGGTSSHAHVDGMNLGLFAKGLDLVPDHGYPEYTGGWPARWDWTCHTRSHVMVLVDGENQKREKGQLRILSPGAPFQMFRADGPEMYEQVDRYERTCALVDISAKDCYVVDVFRVAGGKEHLYDFHGAEGPVSSRSLATSGGRREFPGSRLRDCWTKEKLRPNEPTAYYLYDGGVTRRPEPGWSLDYRIEDTCGVARKGAKVHLRLTHFTPADDVVVAKGEPPPSTDAIQSMHYLLVRRRARRGKPLESIYVSVIEPYDGRRVVRAIRREPISREGVEDVVLSIDLPGGRQDLIILPDREQRGKLQGEIQGVPFSLDGSALWVRMGKRNLQSAILVNGRSFTVGGVRVALPKVTERLEAQYVASRGCLCLSGKDASSARAEGVMCAESRS